MGADMATQRKIRDYGVVIGSMKTGKRNSITDVEGVTVGHTTLDDGDMKTGVTAIVPHPGNLFKEKVLGATYVINGFGKTTGTIQIDELGTIETPIILTNTLSVGVCTNALVKYMLEQNPEIGRTTGTVNPIVCECNDMLLNDIRAGFVKEEHVFQAFERASVDFDEGSVGAGTGMACFGFKGGIGSSSRLLEMSHGTYTIGVLVLSNFGLMKDFRLNGKPVGKKLSSVVPPPHKIEDQGSIIIVVATDLPVSERQLKRIMKRASVGLSRTGSYFGNGSGDLVIGFSTATKQPHFPTLSLLTMETIHETDIDQAFIAVADATEEAILNSMITAKTTIGRGGYTLYSLADFLGTIFGDSPAIL
jgi:D-aminopeptidase